MEPISLAGTLIAVLQITSSVISVCYNYRQGSKNASQEAIRISHELNSLKDVLESLLGFVEKSEPNDASRMSTLELLAKPDGSLFACQTELEKLKMKLDPGVGWRAVGKALAWPLKEDQTQKALSSLERLKSTMQLALSADQATLSVALREDVEDLAQVFQKHSSDQNRHNIYKWLAAPNHYANHATSRKKHHSKTGTWLLACSKYDCWLHGPSSFLWLYGIPGSGKTILCSTVIEQLVHYSHQTPRTAVTYFYFDFNDTENRDVNSLMRSLIFQLSIQCETMPQPLLELYQRHKCGAEDAAEASLRATLRSLVLTFHNVYVVIDALDESSSCEDVLQFIETIRAWELPQLHLMVSSRQLPEIEESLLDSVTGRICLQQESQMNEDIMTYIADTLANDKSLAKWPAEIRTQVQLKLLTREDGMFQWVVCQFDMLRRCVSVNAIRQAMAVIPKSLDETYERILLEIDEIHHPEVIKILKALTASNSFLVLEEIVEILAVDLDSIPPRFEPDRRLIDPKSILSMCSSLVTISKETRWAASGNQETISALRFAHTSVVDYLLCSKSFKPSQFRFSRQSARQFIAQTCLVYLLNPEFSDGCAGVQFKQKMKGFPFLGHSFWHWPEYLQREEGDPENHLDERTKEVLQTFFATSKLPSGGNFAFWVGMLIPYSPIQYILNTQPLYYAASFGLTEVVRIILDTEKDIDINALGGRANASALHAAVYRGHVDIVRMLLEKRADPNLPNVFHESPVYWARKNRNKEIEKLLCQYGAATTIPIRLGNFPGSSLNVCPTVKTKDISSTRGSYATRVTQVTASNDIDDSNSGEIEPEDYNILSAPMRKHSYPSSHTDHGSSKIAKTINNHEPT